MRSVNKGAREGDALLLPAGKLCGPAGAISIELPSIFLSGFIYPVAAMPRALQLISYAIPLRYFLIVVRGIVLKAVGVAQLWPEIIALSIFAVVVITAAATRFQKRLD